jgi:hypothetical protein
MGGGGWPATTGRWRVAGNDLTAALAAGWLAAPHRRREIGEAGSPTCGPEATVTGSGIGFDSNSNSNGFKQNLNPFKH